MGLSQRVTELLERWLGENEQLTQISPKVKITNKGCTTKNITNLVVVDTTTNGTVILAANPNRVSYSIQNNGTYPILLSYGENVSVTNYSKIITGSSSIRLGDGGVDQDENESNCWTGEIRGITESGSSIVSILEKIEVT